MAAAAGHPEMVAWCLPSETVFGRAAKASGLDVSSRMEDGMVRIAIRAVPAPARTARETAAAGDRGGSRDG